MKAVKFPSGNVGHELLHYMGADDEQNLSERPLLAQQLAAKCKLGKVVELTDEELAQLIHEAENALDIKADHVGGGDWNALQQYTLTKFLIRLKTI